MGEWMKDGKGNRAIRNEICEVIMEKEREWERERKKKIGGGEKIERKGIHCLQRETGERGSERSLRKLIFIFEELYGSKREAKS